MGRKFRESDRMRVLLAWGLGVLGLVGGRVSAATFDAAQPLLQKYCVECHNASKQEGSLNLEAFAVEADYRKDADLLEHLEWVIGEEEMPPMKAAQPTAEERETMFDFVHETLLALQNAQPNDPGLVIMPRINMEEYDYVVAELTGEELEMGQYLTADGTSGEGFLNVGAGQTMSVGQFEGFLSTAKKLFNQARAIPGAGLFWSTAPIAPPESDQALKKHFRETWEGWHAVNAVTAYNEQEKALRRAVGMVYGAYMEAAWRYRYRAELGMPDATFAEIAAGYDVPLFADSVERVFQLLNRQEDHPWVAQALRNPVIGQLATKWQELPPPSAGAASSAREQIRELDEWRKRASAVNDYSGEVGLERKVADRAASQARRGQYHRSEVEMDLDLKKSESGKVYLAATPTAASQGNDLILWQDGKFVMEDGSKKPWQDLLGGFTDQDGASRAFGSHPRGDALEGDAIALEAPGYLAFDVPPGATGLEVAMRYDPNHALETASVRIAAFGEAPADYDETFRSAKVVGDGQPKGASRAWNALEEAASLDSTNAGHTRMRNEVAFHGWPEEWFSFYGVERPDRTSARPQAVFSLTAADAQAHASPAALRELKSLRTQLDAFVKAETLTPEETEAYAVAKIRDFATRAWSRPPTEAEIEDLTALYRVEIEKGQLYEGALETALTAVMVSPEFLYRFTESRNSTDPYALADRELATRLAYVLWGSIPDPELLAAAEAGQLREPEGLNAQVARMLQDPRAEAFVEQFFGHWLHFAGFDKFSGPDAEKFEEFDDPLKQAMYDEAVLFFIDLIQNDRPVQEMFTADYTYLNERLAKHYDIRGVEGASMRPVRLETDRRGGILGMGAFLTNTSKPLRTSPVHRGVWLYEHVLGIPIPAPPANVPQLSDEEVNEAGETIAEQLAQHRDNPACFSCHDRFDPLGVAFENYDPIGRWREEVAKGAPVNSLGEFGDGSSLSGLPGLREYVASREEVFLETFARKLIGYSLGRAFLPTDRPLSAQVIEALKQNNFSVRSALEVVVNSPQFRMRRDESVTQETDEPASADVARLHP